MNGSNLAKVFGGLGVIVLVTLGKNCGQISRVASTGAREARVILDDVARSVDQDVYRVRPHPSEQPTLTPHPQSTEEIGYTTRQAVETGVESVARSDEQWRPLPDEVIERSAFSSVRQIEFKPVRNPHLLAAFPSNGAEFEAVYGKTPSAAANSEARRLSSMLGSPDRSTAWSSPPPKSDLSGALRSLDEPDLVVIVSHAEEEGAVLVLPNGQRMRHAEVHETCAAEGVRCVVLSCYSRDLGINTEITAEDALAMWDIAQREWKKSQSLDATEYMKHLREARVNLAMGRNIAMTAVVAAVAATAGGGAYEIVNSRQRPVSFVR